MILGFKDQFIPYIEEGSKTHTIRSGFRWKVGMRADLYERPRQKGMRLIFRAPAVRVQEIEIRAVAVPDDIETLEVRIDHSLLDPAETEALFRRDGFRKPDTVPAVNLAYGFWLGRLPFHGQIIHWDYEERFMGVSETCYHLSRARAKWRIA